MRGSPRCEAAPPPAAGGKLGACSGLRVPPGEMRGVTPALGPHLWKEGGAGGGRPRRSPGPRAPRSGEAARRPPRPWTAAGTRPCGRRGHEPGKTWETAFPALGERPSLGAAFAPRGEAPGGHLAPTPQAQWRRQRRQPCLPIVSTPKADKSAAGPPGPRRRDEHVRPHLVSPLRDLRSWTCRRRCPCFEGKKTKGRAGSTCPRPLPGLRGPRWVGQPGQRRVVRETGADSGGARLRLLPLGQHFERVLLDLKGMRIQPGLLCVVFKPDADRVGRSH